MNQGKDDWGDIMTRSLICTALLLFLASGAHGAPAGQPFENTGDCVANCATTVEVGPVKFVVARNAQGEIFDVVRLDIAPDAELVESTATQTLLHEEGQGATQDEGGTVDQQTETYVTTTEVVVVTTTYYYNAQGDLQDIEVNETRFPREDEEEQ